MMIMFDITSISSVDRCAKAAPMEVLDIDGKKLGFQLLVLGAQADAVQKHTNKVVNAEIMQTAIARKTGKQPDPKTMEDTIASNVEAALVRVTGWEGVQQKYDKELLRTAINKNPHWVNQIIEFSNNLENFTKAS